MRTHAYRRRRTLSLRDHPARRISLAEPLQRMAPRAPALLSVRIGIVAAAGHADVFPGRSVARIRPDVLEHTGRTRARASDRDVRLGGDRSRARVGLHVRYRAERKGRDADGLEPGRVTT